MALHFYLLENVQEECSTLQSERKHIQAHNLTYTIFIMNEINLYDFRLGSRGFAPIYNKSRDLYTFT